MRFVNAFRFVVEKFVSSHANIEEASFISGKYIFLDNVANHGGLWPHCYDGNADEYNTKGITDGCSQTPRSSYRYLAPRIGVFLGAFQTTCEPVPRIRRRP